MPSRIKNAVGNQDGSNGMIEIKASAAEVESLQSTIRFQKARIIALQEELDK